MTDDELAAIKARCDSATQGPWFVRFRHNRTTFPIVTCQDHDEGPIVAQGYAGLHTRKVLRGDTKEEANSNNSFIAHSRTDIPALLAHIEAQAERIKGLEMRVQKESEERRMRV